MPTKQCDDHKALMNIIDELKSLGKELKTLLDVSDSNNDAIISKSNEFKAKFAYLKQHLLDHLAEEEEFWIDIYEKYGQEGKMIKKDEQNIINHGLTTKGEEYIGFKMAFCSFATGLGADLKGLY